MSHPIAQLPPDAVAAIERMLAGANGKGWVRLRDLLQAAASDPEVIASPGAAGFVEIMLALAADAISTANAVDALLPLDGELPKGRFAKPFMDRAGRGEASVKKLVRLVLPALERRLKREASHREVWDACAKHRGTSIQFMCSPTWGTPVRAVPPHGAPASWGRFRVIISEVRASPKP